MQTILVTGGTGYIGSHTVVELIQKGYNVIVVDNLSNSTTDSLDGIGKICGKRPIFYQNDCSNMSEMTSIFDRHPEIAASIHFAASKAVGESVEKPLFY